VCEEIAAQQMSAEAAAELLQRAAQQGMPWGYAMGLAVQQGMPQLPGMAAEQTLLTGRQLQRFLQDALTAGDSDGLCKLCQCVAATEAAAGAAAAHCISADQMQPVLSLALAKTRPKHSSITVAAAEQLFELRAAKALSPAAVVPLLAACVKYHDTTSLNMVGQLPAAEQLDQRSAEGLVRKAIAAKYYDSLAATYYLD
jgi:hypothetical protein